MEKGLVKIYFGEGKGKSTSSMGRALVCAGEEKEVFVIQFLKGKMTGSLDYLKRLEPEIKVFRFEREEAFMKILVMRRSRRRRSIFSMAIILQRKYYPLGNVMY